MYHKIKKQKKVQRKNKDGDENIGDVETTDKGVDDLIRRMQSAYESDKANNAKGQPAIKKFMMANEVYQELRKKPVQESFLNKNGAE